MNYIFSITPSKFVNQPASKWVRASEIIISYVDATENVWYGSAATVEIGAPDGRLEFFDVKNMS